MSLEIEGTLLNIIPLSGNAPLLVQYSGRALTQTLEPITGISGSGGVLGTLIRRDINFNLVNLIPDGFRKYMSTVSCKDVNSPAFDDAWLGIICQVDCAVELSYAIGGTPTRPVVGGSERTEGHFTFYRPSLTMMIVDIKNALAEWEGECSWKLDFQEV